MIAVMVVWALAAGLSAAPAVAQTQGSGGGSGFPDVPADAFYAESVASLAGDGVFSGTECEAGLCPGDAIDRKTIAVWLVRVLDGSDPGPVTDSGFSDVDAAGFHAPFVKHLADLGVTAGCGDGSRFCGDRTVTRAQMAAFLSRAFDLADGPDPGFSDVPSGAWYAADVARLAAARVTSGCGDGTRFCPGRDTTRGQMAVFLARADGRVALQDRLAEPLAPAVIAPRAAAAYEVPAALEDAEQWSRRSLGGSRVLYFRVDRRIGPHGYSFGLGALYAADRDGTGLELISDQVIVDLYECYDHCGSTEYLGRSRDSRHFTYFAYTTAEWSSDTNQFSVDAALVVAAADGSSNTELAGGLSASALASIRRSWSPDSRHIAYTARDEDGTTRLFVASADGTKATELAENPNRWSWSWSPNSRHIAYNAVNEEGHERLFVVAADGPGTVQLAGANASTGSWSPDGRHIAYTAHDAGRRVFVVAADGSETVRSAEIERYGGAYAWSPDSRHIAYTALDDEGNQRLFVAAADGSDTVQLAGTNASIGNWSPDGRHLLYRAESHSTEDGRISSRYIARAGGADSVELGEGYGGHAWSPDGRHIAYTRSDGTGNYALFVAAADGTGAVEVAEGSGLVLLTRVWSPDGRHVAYQASDGEGNPSVFVVTADGARNVRVAGRLYRPEGPVGISQSVAWAPEGGRIAFLEPPAETTGLAYEISLVAVTISDVEREVVAAFSVDVCDGHTLLGWTGVGIVVRPIDTCAFYG